MTKEADIALFVGCPECKVDSGERCRAVVQYAETWELGAELAEPHAERVKYAYAHRAGGLYALHKREPAEALCPFMRVGDGARELHFSAQSYRPFKPVGLIIWGAPADARVQIFTGTDLKLSVDIVPVPARWFAHYESFADIVKKLDDGKAPPSWGTWDVVHPGVYLRVHMTTKPRAGETYHTAREFSADEIHAIEVLMWGHTVQ